MAVLLDLSLATSLLLLEDPEVSHDSSVEQHKWKGGFGDVYYLRPLPSEIEAFVRGKLFADWMVHR